MKHLRRVLLLALLVMFALLVPSLPASAEHRSGCKVRDHWIVMTNHYVDLIARRTCTTRDELFKLNPWLESRKRYEPDGDLNVIIHPGERIVTARRASAVPDRRPAVDRTPDRHDAERRPTTRPTARAEPTTQAAIPSHNEQRLDGFVPWFVVGMLLVGIVGVTRLVRRSSRPRAAVPVRRWITREHGRAVVSGLLGGTGAGLGLSYGVGLPLLQEQYQLSTWTSVLLATAPGVITVLALFGLGPLGDRFDKRRMIVAIGAVAVACFVTVPLVPNVWLKVALAAGAGAAGVIDGLGRSLLETRRPLADADAHKRRTSVIGASFILGLGLVTVGYPVLLAWLDAWAYWLIAGGFGVLIVLARLSLPADAAATGRVRQRGALRSAARDRVVRLATVLATANGVALGVQVLGAMSLMLTEHGTADEVIGYFGVRQILAALVIPKLHRLSPLAAAIGMSTLPFGVAALALASPSAFVWLFFVALTLIEVTTNVLWNGVLARTPAAASAKSLVIAGRVFGANVLGGALGVLVHGWLQPRGTSTQDAGVIGLSLALSLLCIPIAARLTAKTRPMVEEKRFEVRPGDLMQMVVKPVPCLRVPGDQWPLGGGRVAVANDGSGATICTIRPEALGEVRQALAPRSRFAPGAQTDSVKDKLRLPLSSEYDAVIEETGRAPLVWHEGSVFKIVGALAHGDQRPEIAEVVIMAPAPERSAGPLARWRVRRREDDARAARIQEIALDHGVPAPWPTVRREGGVVHVDLVLELEDGHNPEAEVTREIEREFGDSIVSHIKVREST